MRVERLLEMEEYIHRRGNVTLRELAEYFNLSVNTVRRDIDELIKGGNFRKVYGGVSSNLKSNVFHIRGREGVNVEQKRVIGALAATCIEDGMTVFIDTGTTTVEAIQFLAKKKDITVVTHNLRAMFELAKYPQIDFLGIGGLYNAAKGSVEGASLIDFLAQTNFDAVLIATTGVSLKNGFTIHSFFEVALKRWLAQHYGKRAILMADSSKFGSSAPYSFVTFEELNTIVTDSRPTDVFTAKIASSGVTLLHP